jgi:hypothetical protein
MQETFYKFNQGYFQGGGAKPKKIDKKVLGKQVYVIGRKQYVKYKKSWTLIADYKKVVDAKEKSNRKKAKN